MSVVTLAVTGHWLLGFGFQLGAVHYSQVVLLMVLECLTDVFIHSFCRGAVQNVGCLLLDCPVVVLSSGLKLMI
jgi:hypothetical protein